MLYSNAYSSSYEELKTYYPRWLLEFTEIDLILKANGGEFDKVQLEIVTIVLDFYIQTMSERRIAALERFLDIQYVGPRTLEERRAMVWSHIIGFGHIGKREIMEIVHTFTEAGCEVTFRDAGNGKSILVITIERGENDVLRLDDIYTALRKKIPGHLGFYTPVEYEDCPALVPPPEAWAGVFNYERISGTYPFKAIVAVAYGSEAITSAQGQGGAFGYRAAGEGLESGTWPERALLAERVRGDASADAAGQAGVNRYKLAGEGQTVARRGDAAAPAGSEAVQGRIKYRVCGDNFFSGGR